MQNTEFYMKNLEPIYCSFLKDRAAEIRKLGVQKIQDTGRIYGSTFLISFLTKVGDILAK